MLKDCVFTHMTSEYKCVDVYRYYIKCILLYICMIVQICNYLMDAPPASIEVLLAADAAGASSIRVW